MLILLKICNALTIKCSKFSLKTHYNCNFLNCMHSFNRFADNKWLWTFYHRRSELLTNFCRNKNIKTKKSIEIEINAIKSKFQNKRSKKLIEFKLAACLPCHLQSRKGDLPKKKKKSLFFRPL